MEKKQMIQDYCRQFNMGGLTADFDRIMIEAEKSEVSYLDYTLELFKAEASHKVKKKSGKTLKSRRTALFTRPEFVRLWI